GLAGAGFADHAERLALGDAERGALHRLELALAQQSLAKVKALGQAFRFENRRLVARQASPALSSIRGTGRAHEIVDHRQPLRPTVARWTTGEERARVRIARIAEELRGRRLLAHLAI